MGWSAPCCIFPEPAWSKFPSHSLIAESPALRREHGDGSTMCSSASWYVIWSHIRYGLGHAVERITTPSSGSDRRRILRDATHCKRYVYHLRSAWRTWSSTSTGYARQSSCYGRCKWPARKKSVPLSSLPWDPSRVSDRWWSPSRNIKFTLTQRVSEWPWSSHNIMVTKLTGNYLQLQQWIILDLFFGNLVASLPIFAGQLPKS